jgi:nucleotide-binding universal stress UspA family protein
LVIPSDSQRVWPRNHPLRILVPLDGSQLSEKILDPARDLVSTLGGELLLLRVIAPSTYQSIAGYEDLVAVPTGKSDDLDAEQQIESIAAKLRACGQSIKSLIVEDTDPASSILATAHDEEIDVIAMSTHGRGGLTRLLLGSVATKVLEQSATPVLLVHPAASHSDSATYRADEHQLV